MVLKVLEVNLDHYERKDLGLLKTGRVGENPVSIWEHQSLGPGSVNLGRTRTTPVAAQDTESPLALIRLGGAARDTGDKSSRCWV